MHAQLLPGYSEIAAMKPKKREKMEKNVVIQISFFTDLSMCALKKSVYNTQFFKCIYKILAQMQNWAIMSITPLLIFIPNKNRKCKLVFYY